MTTKTTTTKITKQRWVEGAIVYQIYPRSFYDSNADGIGDIKGITAKLEYIKGLGVNAIWISPFYPSPMADFGYDIADYCDVDPIFGSLDDAKELISVSHSLNIKVMLDLVPNHSSDEHEWFRQSRQSSEGPYADWYIWHDAKGVDKSGNPLPPNNWVEVLTGETAWEWEPSRQQFYLHSFDVKQPDLNWSNTDVRDAIKNAMRFWLDLGVDGFRVDAVTFMAKDPLLRDEPKNPYFNPNYDMKYCILQHPNNHGWPKQYEYLSELAGVLKEPKYQESPRFMVLEAPPDSHEKVEEYLSYYKGIDPLVSAPFNFEGLGLPWKADVWTDFLTRFHGALDDYSPLCVSSYAFGNHDQHRIVSRVGEDVARSMAVLLLTLPGMTFIYNGEELGMKNGEIPNSMVQDPGARGGSGRDPERTPMQWTGGKNAGFSLAKSTWLPIAKGFEICNVESQDNDTSSFLSLYRALGYLRNNQPALKYGEFQVINTKNKNVLGYIREYKGTSYRILINFSDSNQKIDPKLLQGELVLSSNINPSDDKAHLNANEAVIIKV